MPTHPILSSKPSKAYIWAVFLAPILIFILIVLARTIYVTLYAVPLPYWDQWDELNLQIGPLFNGTWHFIEIFAPHSEHRIVFTHLTGFFLTWLNRHRFDNLVEAYFNTLIYAALFATLYCMFVRHERLVRRRLIIAVVVVVLGVLPFDWENILTGFQNQFYFLELAAVIMVGIATYRNISSGTIALLAVLALASLFTMASGLLAVPAVCLAIFIRMWREPIRWTSAAILFVIITAVAIFGFILLKRTPATVTNDWIHAHNAAEFGKSLLVAVMWPFRTHRVWLGLAAALLIWLPAIIWAYAFIKRPHGESNEIFAVSLAAWVLLQFIAVAYERGDNMDTLTSRYTEIAAIGIAANGWLALKLAQRKANAYWPRIIVGMAMVLVGLTLVVRNTPGYVAQMQGRHAFTTIETNNVHRYYSGVPLPVPPPWPNSQILPFPNVQQLEQMLDNPVVRAVLPPAAFPQPDPTRDAPLSSAAASLQHSIQRWFPKGTRVTGAVLRSQP